MQNFPAAYKTANDSMAKRPVYVFEVIWAGGGPGVSGTNDIYFTTCDVNDILNFPYPARWFPFLDAESISGISQSVDPINGVSTIGQLSVSITDYGGMVSNIVQAADVKGHGLRRQRCEVSMLYKGMDWADKVRVRSMYVEDLKLANYNQYKLTCTDVQARMRKTVFNPAQTTLSAIVAASGAVTLNVLDARLFNLVTSVTHGSSGFVKINDEIMRFNVKTDASLTVPAAGRGMYGTTAAAHAINDTVDELIYLNENPITMALKILESSGVASANGTFDAYPAAWGCNLKTVDAVDQAGLLQVGELLTGLSPSHLPGDGLQFEFLLESGVEAKKFIEDSILKIIGAFGFVRADGSYSIRAYNDLANAAKENAVAVLNENNVVSWGDLNYSYTDLANQMWIEYDEFPKLSGKYLRAALFVDTVSKRKWGDAKMLRYTARGIPPDSIFVSQLYQRFQRVMARYSRPPMKMSATLLPKMHGMEIGDIVRITLPIRDLISGATLDRAFEIVSTSLKPKTGEVAVECIAQPERGGMWFGGVGEVASIIVLPNVIRIPVSTSQQLVLQSYDGSGAPVPTPAVSWLSLTKLVGVDANGLVTAGAGVGSDEVFAVVGSKRYGVTITVIALPNTNPVASVQAFPSEVNMGLAQNKIVTALAYDLVVTQVNGVTFTWASSNPAVATVTPGPAASATITSVSNGTANITATETVSSVVSPAMPVTVAVPQTPTYTPPAIAASAYQIGTQITTMGGVGGPHTIPDGYNFAAGDYWFDGDVLLASGTICTINGTVRIFSLGVVRINGTVDGKGRGGAAAPSSGSAYAFNGDSRLFNNWSEFRSVGSDATSVGFIGSGGVGAYTKAYSYATNAAGVPTITAPPLYSALPSINLIGSAVDGYGSLTALSGIPTNAQGGGGSCGSVMYHQLGTSLSRTWDGGSGGAGGAGLVIMARGIYVVAGDIDLSGADSTSGTWTCPGGPGGGGSFIALAERNIYGLPVMSIDTERLNLNPGIAAAQYVVGFYVYSYPTYTIPPTAGKPGGFIQQVIG